MPLKSTILSLATVLFVFLANAKTTGVKVAESHLDRYLYKYRDSTHYTYDNKANMKSADYFLMNPKTGNFIPYENDSFGYNDSLTITIQYVYRTDTARFKSWIISKSITKINFKTGDTTSYGYTYDTSRKVFFKLQINYVIQNPTDTSVRNLTFTRDSVNGIDVPAYSWRRYRGANKREFYAIDEKWIASSSSWFETGSERPFTDSGFTYGFLIKSYGANDYKYQYTVKQNGRLIGSCQYLWNGSS